MLSCGYEPVDFLRLVDVYIAHFREHLEILDPNRI